MSLHFSLSEQALMWVYLFYIQSKRSLLDNFISNETGQVGWAKIEEKKTRRNTWHTRKQNLACLTYAPCGTRTVTLSLC